MSVLATVFIAIAAAFIGFIIGICVDVAGSVPIPASIEPNPVKTFNAPLKPKEEVHEPVVVSTVVLPKRIKELEYNKRVNAALKEVIDKAVDVWISSTDKVYKRRIANNLYHDWHVKIEDANYRKYNPKFQRLNIVGRRVGNWFKFEVFWEAKDQKRDCIGYARSHK